MRQEFEIALPSSDHIPLLEYARLMYDSCLGTEHVHISTSVALSAAELSDQFASALAVTHAKSSASLSDSVKRSRLNSDSLLLMLRMRYTLLTPGCTAYPLGSVSIDWMSLRRICKPNASLLLPANILVALSSAHSHLMGHIL